jgi:hypothetical protein
VCGNILGQKQDSTKNEMAIFGDSLNIKSPSRKLFLTGTISTANDRKPLAGAAIFVDGLKIGNNSDQNGQYVIQLNPGKYTIIVRYLGKVHLEKKIALYSNGVLNFEMEEKAQLLDEVVVRSKTPDENVKDVTAGTLKLNMSEISKIPPVLGEMDIVKSLQMLPGISSVGEGSSGFNVRGGNVDQNLTLMDNGQIFNTGHGLGIISAFNPDVVEDFTLYKGNIPAQYGGRTSSVLNVRTRTGDFNKYKVKAGVGLLSARAAVEGPIFKDKTSFLIASRFSYSDWILKPIKNLDIKNSSASFYDVNATVTHRFSGGTNLSLKFYRGYDYFRYSNQFGYEYATQLVTLNWNQILKKNWGNSFYGTSGTYNSELADYDILKARAFSNGISYLQFKDNLLYTLEDKHVLNAGAELLLYKNSPEISSPLGTNSTTIKREVPKSRGNELGFYVNEEYTINSVFSISAGLRYSVFQSLGMDTTFNYKTGLTKSLTSIADTVIFSRDQVNKTYQGFEPRISARVGLGESGSVKASYNRTRQYLHRVSNTSAPTPVDVWQMSDYHFQPQIADNFSIGYFKNLKKNEYEISVEGFYKLTDNVIDYKSFAQILLNKHLETDVLQGQGKSYGVELFIRKNAGAWTGWLSYTFSRSLIQMNGNPADDKINNGQWYPSNFDKPHNLSITAARKIARKIRFGTNLVYSTGRPITAVEAYYLNSGISIPTYSDRNKYRIPDYWRVDVSFTFDGLFKKLDDQLIFSIYNLFGRENAYSIYFQQNQSPILQAYKLSILGSALPSITYNINF